jgi:two-component system chemotaxis sensor kinase CheA
MAADFGDLIDRLKAILEGENGPPKKAAAKPSSVGEKQTKPVATVSVESGNPVLPVEEDVAAKMVHAAPADSNVRINVNLLDRLMNLVGELVLARNQIVQISGAKEESALMAAAQRIDLVTTELQGEVMKTRLQPINTVWSKFPRVVRDVSHDVGKNVRLEFEGKETELDRTIIEAIKDPLTHIVRNSIDHGIESPEERRKAGKPQEGVLTMSAFHEGGQVNIEIRDDGKGINPTRVKAKAVESGLITADQAAQMSDHDAIQLIFHAGLSTAEKITNISGRGVGMDVVKTNIERVGGAIGLLSSGALLITDSACRRASLRLSCQLSL